jgi:hypothetical protein
MGTFVLELEELELVPALALAPLLRPADVHEEAVEVLLAKEDEVPPEATPG